MGKVFNTSSMCIEVNIVNAFHFIINCIAFVFIKRFDDELQYMWYEFQTMNNDYDHCTLFSYNYILQCKICYNPNCLYHYLSFLFHFVYIYLYKYIYIYRHNHILDTFLIWAWYVFRLVKWYTNALKTYHWKP